MSPLLLPDGRPGESKAAWRALGRARREALPRAEWARRDAGWLRTGLDEIRSLAATTVALYLSRPGEPGTVQLAEDLAKEGVIVLAPVLTDGSGHGLHEPFWARCRPGCLRDGLWGIPEPTGPAQPAEVLGQADLVICSALWVGRDGHRIGTGGGWYDRALEHRRPGAPVWALVDDSELVDQVPHDGWDRPVDAALTPSALVALGRPAE